MGFNLATFNTSPFNIPVSSDQFLQITMDGVGESSLTANANYSSTIDIDGVGVMATTINRVTTVRLEAYGEGKIQILLGKIRETGIEWQGVGRLTINNETATVSLIEYVGVVNPSDRIMIDCENFVVTKNNIPDLHNFLSDFPELEQGVNTIAFEDGEGERIIVIRVEHKDRFV